MKTFFVFLLLNLSFVGINHEYNRLMAGTPILPAVPATTGITTDPCALLKTSTLLNAGGLTTAYDFNHPTDLWYVGRRLANQRDLLLLSRSVVGEIEQSSAPNEVWSARSQHDLLLLISDPEISRLLAIPREATELGMLDSDKGKARVFKLLLTERSLKSDILFNFLTGRIDSKSYRVLRRILDQSGYQERTLINHELTNDEIRTVFKDLPVLQSWLHDLPGVADAVIMHELGVLTESQFADQLTTNLFHNGPAAGFWGLFTNMLVPGAIKGSKNPNAYRLLENTVYLAANGQIVYPMSLSAGGIFHTIGDRLSQATNGGVTKIFFEIIAFTPALKAFADLSLNSPYKTIEQVEVLQKHITNMQHLDRITARQAQLLNDFSEQAISRLILFASKMELLIADSANIKPLAADPIGPGPSSITLRGRIFQADALKDNPQALDDFIGYFMRVLDGVMTETGNPMRPFIIRP